MKSQADYKQEFSATMSKVETIIDRAKKEKRDLTEAEAAENDRHFARIEELRYITGQESPPAATETVPYVPLSNKIKGDGLPALPKCHPEYGRRSELAGDMEMGKFSNNDLARPLKFNESAASYLRVGTPTVGIGEYLRSMVLGARSEKERFALSIGTDSAGGYTVPTSLGALVIDAVRAESVFTLAGAQVVPLTGGMSKIARIATDPAPTWRAENAVVAQSDMTFEGVTLQPKTLAVIVRASRELLEDSLNINAAIGTSLSAAFAAEVDRVAGWGSGTANEPLGISNTPGVSTVTSTANGDVLTNYSRLLDALYMLQSNNVQPNGVIMSPRESRAINGFADTTQQPLRTPTALETVPFYVSSRVPTNETQGTATTAATILMGDFTKLVLGVRSEFRIEVLKERFADNYQYGFLAHLRMDTAVMTGKAFAKVTGII